MKSDFSYLFGWYILNEKFPPRSSSLYLGLILLGINPSHQWILLWWIFRFRDSTDKTDDNEQPSKPHKIAKKSPNDLWRPFVAKYRKAYQRDKSSILLSKHPTYTARMRTILLDWLIEVCEVYRLHRETFYLSADFFDRYMSRTLDVPKTKLQLIGKFSSCLLLINSV